MHTSLLYFHSYYFNLFQEYYNDADTDETSTADDSGKPSSSSGGEASVSSGTESTDNKSATLPSKLELKASILYKCTAIAIKS